MTWKVHTRRIQRISSEVYTPYTQTGLSFLSLNKKFHQTLGHISYPNYRGQFPEATTRVLRLTTLRDQGITHHKH